jgi:hypothetical protein
MEYALILLFVAAIAVGVVSAVVKTWSFHTRLYSLEDRLTVVEGVQQREVKVRAATERWKKEPKDDAAIEAALLAPAPAKQRKLNYWERPDLKKGAYAP